MSKVKAADAVFGEWYEVNGIRLRCASMIVNKHGDRIFVNEDGYISPCCAYEELTHLPGCTGWDWEPQPDTSLAASIERMENFFAGRGEYSGQMACHECYEDDEDWIRIRDGALKCEQYKREFTRALDCVDRVFQKCETNPEPILPDFVGLGQDKFEAVIRLAEEYVVAKEKADKWDEYISNAAVQAQTNDPDGVGESENGKKYQERTKPTEKPKRREFFIDPKCRGHINVAEITETGFHSRYELHVREVLPGDPSPEWVNELVRLCEKMTECRQSHQIYWHWADEIGKHLAKRGDK